MTRDEAVALVNKCNGGIGAEYFVDALLNLGMLKLDDPVEKDRQEIVLQLSKSGFSTGEIHQIFYTLGSHGFKITR